jgi:hypothetical protein
MSYGFLVAFFHLLIITMFLGRLSHVQLLKVLKALHKNLALAKLLNPHQLQHGFQKLMNILIPSYLIVQIIPETKFECFSKASKSKPSSMNRQ